VIRAGLLRLGGVMLGEVLSADRGHRGPRVPCGNGHEAVFAGYRDKSFDTVLGLVTVTRAWYHCAKCGRGLAPRDAELGVTGTSMSPGLAAMNDLAAAAGPFAAAARLLEEIGGVRLTVKRVERAAEASGTALAAAGRDRAALVSERASTSVIATFEPAPVFADLVKAEGIRRGADHVRQLTVLGDGAAWIWGIATAKFPEATQIVDLFHAREHLHDLARKLEFMLLDRKDEWLAARLEDLDYGYIDGITSAVREYPLEGVKKDEIDTALGYFENNAPHMRYHWFRQCGLFVGSGVVESSCKTVIGQRLKQSGMHWTLSGADAIIALRCREASSQWEAVCNTPDTQTRTA
jgi:hypothetical protein